MKRSALSLCGGGNSLCVLSLAIHPKLSSIVLFTSVTKILHEACIYCVVALPWKPAPNLIHTLRLARTDRGLALASALCCPRVFCKLSEEEGR